ncbi:MAG: hypothetical protein KY469_22490 [Actinobacteria bacterium]|nr:hypothetical protein [Actinomycetota bacterium]
MSDLRLALGMDTTSAAAAQVTAALDEVRVVVRLASGLDPRAALAAGALVSMVARLHAHVDIDGDASCDVNPWAAKSVTDVLGRVAAHRPAAASEPTRDLVVAVGLPERGDQTGQHLAVQGVAGIRAVDRHGEHRAPAFGEHDVHAADLVVDGTAAP